MLAQRAMSRSQENKQLISQQGNTIELFGFHQSALILMDYGEERKLRLLSLGPFSINLVMHINYPNILATFCSINGFQWPLTKDTVVVRIAEYSFIFALPGLLFGFQFPPCFLEESTKTLIGVFMHFGHYKDINDKGLGYPFKDNEPNLLNKIRPLVEPLAHQTLMQLGQLPGCSRFCFQDKKSTYLIAIHMSASTKVIIESMKNVTLTSNLIKIRGINPPSHDSKEAYASVCVFSCLVDSVELSWLMSHGHGHMLTNEPLSCFEDIGVKVWSLNEEGLLAYKVILEHAAEQEETVVNEKVEMWQGVDNEKEKVGGNGTKS